jgi:hypothetical protein
MKVLLTLQEKSTDPETKFIDLYTNPEILVPMIFSIVFHSLIYVYFLFITYKTILQPKKIDYSIFKKIFIYLLIIMTVGYPLRLWRIKEANKIEESGKLYFLQRTQFPYSTWYFLG